MPTEGTTIVNSKKEYKARTSSGQKKGTGYKKRRRCQKRQVQDENRVRGQKNGFR